MGRQMWHAYNELGADVITLIDYDIIYVKVVIFNNDDVE